MKSKNFKMCGLIEAPLGNVELADIDMCKYPGWLCDVCPIYARWEARKNAKRVKKC